MYRVYRITDLEDARSMALRVARLSHDGARFMDVDRVATDGMVRTVSPGYAAATLRFWRALEGIEPARYALTRD